MERFTLYKGETGLWVVADNKAEKYEDAVIYTFKTKGKAVKFKEMMVAEYGTANNPAAGELSKDARLQHSQTTREGYEQAIL
jgi:hypothetical protein